MTPGLRGTKDFLTGLLFLTIGAGAMVVAREYPFGTAAHGVGVLLEGINQSRMIAA